MKLRDLAKVLNGSVNGVWINVPGLGHSDDDRSLGFKFDANDPDGFIVSSFAEDDPVESRQHVRKILQKVAVGGILTVQSETALNGAAHDQAKRARAMELWEQATPLTGTIVETYLASRGCSYDETAPSAESLRYHPACPFGAHQFPAMLALMRNVTGKPVGVHRTALADDGTGKRIMPVGMNQKMMLGAAKNAAVRLHPGVAHMGIAEGIETALSAHVIFGIPVWAVLSAGGITSVPIIPGIKELTIFADHDNPGLKAALTCARRCQQAGVECAVRYPEVEGADWNDYLRGGVQ